METSFFIMVKDDIMEKCNFRFRQAGIDGLFCMIKYKRKYNDSVCMWNYKYLILYLSGACNGYCCNIVDMVYIDRMEEKRMSFVELFGSVEKILVLDFLGDHPHHSYTIDEIHENMELWVTREMVLNAVDKLTEQGVIKIVDYKWQLDMGNQIVRAVLKHDFEEAKKESPECDYEDCIFQKILKNKQRKNIMKSKMKKSKFVFEVEYDETKTTPSRLIHSFALAYGVINCSKGKSSVFER